MDMQEEKWDREKIGTKHRYGMNTRSKVGKSDVQDEENSKEEVRKETRQVDQEKMGVERGEKEKQSSKKSVGPVVGKVDMQDEESSKAKRRLDEFELGEIFTVISKTMVKEIESVVGRTPEDLQKVMKEGLSEIAKAVEDTMSGISDIVRLERKERKDQEKMTEEKLTNFERKVEDKVQAVNAEVESLRSEVVHIKIGEKVKEMEKKVKSSMNMVKVMDINIGVATDSKATIVREALREVRRCTRKEEVASLNRILTRTRVVVLGRKTEGKQEGGRTVQTVPIVFQCQDRKDAEALERALRIGGFFPTFHWPGEILEFIGRVREEVRKTTQDRYIRIRPEIVQGTVKIRADTKANVGSTFGMKGIWVCPPLNRELWEEVEGLYSPQVVGKGSRGYF
jgi:hypothetical protein